MTLKDKTDKAKIGLTMTTIGVARFQFSAIWQNLYKKIRHHILTLTEMLGVPLRAIAAYLIKKPWARCLFGSFHPQRMSITALDLNLADPALAYEIYHGRFALAGRIVRTGALSPWLVEPASHEWEEALHEMGWLRHMNAAKTVIASAHARTLVEEWIGACPHHINRIAFAPCVTARRIISWISHADMLLSGASANFERKFLKILGFNIRYLRLIRPLLGKTQPGRLDVHFALCFADLAFGQTSSAPPASIGKSEKQLEQALATNILADGGHISRNPAALLPIFADLAALCLYYQQNNRPIPVAFTNFLERIDSALRFFQHRDQTLANFNGVGPLLPERLSGLLNIRNPAAAPQLALPIYAPDSGFQRLAQGATIVLVDTGRTPKGRVSNHAHAGCLSFEMSSGAHRFIVNCGVDPHGPDEFRHLGRLSAAHSTATLNDTSSCRWTHQGRWDTPIKSGPNKVRVKNIETQNCVGFVAYHDGYSAPFQLLHQRSMALSRDGNLLQGADRFVKLKQQKKSSPKVEPVIATIRFHLHPDVEVSQLDSKTLRLEVMRADVWTLTCGLEMSLEDSIYFCDLAGPTKTRQIVLSYDVEDGQEIYWSLHREVHRPRHSARKN